MYSNYFSIVFLSLIIVVMIQLQAQDTTDYFPHHLGDTWEYYHDGFEFDTLQTKIVFDSTDSAGNHYVCKEYYFINPIDPEGVRYYKIDTLGNVYETNSHFNFPRWIYYAQAQKDKIWLVNEHGDIARIKNIYEDTLFSVPARIKEIWYYFAGDTSDTTTWLHQEIWRLSDRFGLMFLGSGDVPFDRYLKGVIIDSITYGDVTPVIVGIEEDINPVIPNEVHLYQNYPNPFNPQTTIRFFLNKSVTVSLTIYDIIGREVMRLLVDERFSTGLHEVIWKGESLEGRPAASGLYFYRLKAGKTVKSQRMLLIR